MTKTVTKIKLGRRESTLITYVCLEATFKGFVEQAFQIDEDLDLFIFDCSYSYAMNFYNSPEFISSDLAKDWKNFQRTLIKPSVDGRILSLIDESGQRIGQGLSLEQHYFNLAPGYRYWHGVTDIIELNVSTL